MLAKKVLRCTEIKAEQNIGSFYLYNFFQSMFIQVAFFFNFCLPRRFWGALKSKQNRILDHLKVSYRKSNRIILFFFFFAFSYSSSSCAQREMEKKVWELNSSTRRARYSMCILIFLTFLYIINILTLVEDHFTKSLH